MGHTECGGKDCMMWMPLYYKKNLFLEYEI